MCIRDSNIGVLDIRQGCSGFVYGLSIADQYIKTKTYKNILVIGSEVVTTQLDFTDEGRGTAVIFGDGAAAALVCATSENKGILSTHLHTDGELVEELASLVAWMVSDENSFTTGAVFDLSGGRATY